MDGAFAAGREAAGGGSTTGARRSAAAGGSAGAAAGAPAFARSVGPGGFDCGAGGRRLKNSEAAASSAAAAATHGHPRNVRTGPDASVGWATGEMLVARVSGGAKTVDCCWALRVALAADASAADKSVAEANRSCGERAIAFSTTVSTSALSAGFTARGGGSGAFTCLMATAIGVSA